MLAAANLVVSFALLHQALIQIGIGCQRRTLCPQEAAFPFLTVKNVQHARRVGLVANDKGPGSIHGIARKHLVQDGMRRPVAGCDIVDFDLSVGILRSGTRFVRSGYRFAGFIRSRLARSECGYRKIQVFLAFGRGQVVLRRDEDLLGDGVEFQPRHRALARRDIDGKNAQQDDHDGNHRKQFRQRKAALFSVLHRQSPLVKTRIFSPPSGIFASSASPLWTESPVIVTYCPSADASIFV